MSENGSRRDEDVRRTRRWPAVVLLCLLCFLLGSRWLVDGAWPETSSTLGTESGGCLMAAGVLGLLGVWERRRGWLPEAGKSGWLGWRALSAALVLTGPALASSFAMRSIGANNGTLALVLAPVVVAVVFRAAGQKDDVDLIGMLWPGLAGTAGLLLLLPEPSFSSWRPWLALAMMPLLVGNGAVFAARLGAGLQEIGGRGWWWGWSLGCLLSSLIFGTLYVLGKGTFQPFSWTGWASGCCLDAAGFVLTLVALQQLGAVRWSAQFLLAPLVALVEGVLLLHPVLEARSWVGLILLLTGACRLLFASSADTVQNLGLNLRENGGVPGA